jgi:uncharacterized protein YndB with AHSA1/START domain
MTMADDRELRVTRLMPLPLETVWRAMSEHIEEWFCPKPWRYEAVIFEKRSGGRMQSVMHGPDGERMESDGVLLEFSPGRRMVFTDAFAADWQPRPVFMVGGMEIAAEGDGTRFLGWARHWSAEASAEHAAMGFESGWGAMAAQLEAVALRLS